MEGSIGEITLGAVLAISGSVFVSHLEARWARKEKKAETVEAESARAFASVMKLVQIRAWLISIRRAINECFDAAVGTPSEAFQPGVKVTPLVGMPSMIEPFSADELGLALRTNDDGLVEKILELQSNYAVSFLLAQTFSKERLEFQSFVRDNAISGEFLDGVAAAVELGPIHRHGLEVRETTLNQILGELMEDLDEMIQLSETTINRLRTSLLSLGGIRVPKITFVEGSNRNANP